MRSNIVLFASRNVKVFFRDRVAVVFSMFAALIVIALYFLFLGDMITDGYSKTLPDARIIIDSWAMAGLMAVVPVTATLGALGIMIQDKITGAARDFTISPMRTYEMVGGYVLGTFIIGMALSLLALAFAEVYIVSNGGSLLSAAQLAKVIGLILLSVLSASAVMFLLALFINSNNAYSTANSIVGTLIGFLTGVFIPIGVLPAAMGSVIKIIPASHSASLFRQVMMEKPMEATAGMSPDDLLKFELDMGVKYEFGNFTVTPELSILILVGVCAVFYMLAVLKLSKKHK
ncbi:MAG: ABC transporter permease [Candidatus Methanoplasma sp.]|jgi:multidrug/hemolysin transport system permease protein|nr:ABC transporter permease [Candidatus Methanoplasma sp.]